MTPKNLTSGDLVADRRADYARMLADAGDAAAAADLMGQALAIAPDWPAGWFQLGRYAERAGLIETAGAAYREVLSLCDHDVFGAELKLAALGCAAMPSQPPSRYVERLFDDYAARFDKALVEGLGYSIPEKLADLIFSHAPDQFATAIDLGCGTGLLGERIRHRVSFLKGYDLSRGMLVKAQEKKIYDVLAQADLKHSAQQGGVPLPQDSQQRADLVTAADVLMYFGDLTPVFQTAASVMVPGGLFAFSVEDDEADRCWDLRASLRFAHGESYVRQLCAQNGFEVVEMRRSPIRRDGEETIIGLLTLTRRIASLPTLATPVDAQTISPVQEGPLLH
ncbi:class I SAM-dependent DNA methyltransferase [Pararhizobium haloflavum]|uniref:class I SAM-dependent DNA methyltransferase n=1 Tax=Pararhizobium haloflavum TaxID=2037914 RepID=UPI000C1A3962|nr:methyltransferase [Pararhizobium haloflavum]